MTFITKKSMHRRTLLKGLGASLALPMLDSMIPALSAQAPSTPRLGFVYVSHGIIFSQWKPTKLGLGFELTPNLKPLEKVNGQFNILTGLSHLEADTKGDGSGDHTRASAAWLTGVHAYDRTRPGVEVKLATTADQLAAQVLGKNSQIPSIELTVDSGAAGSCDSGDCFYVNTVSWRNPNTPNMCENQPRVVFERLFGDGGSDRERHARLHEDQSILDGILDQARGLNARLGEHDRSKLSSYLDNVREVERRIQQAETQHAQELTFIDKPLGVPDSFGDHVALIFELMAIAMQADLARVFTFMMSRESSQRTFPEIDIADPWHVVSHHGDQPEKVVRNAKINALCLRMFARFLERLQSTPDGTGSLLDHSLLFYGSGMANSNVHATDPLPMIAVGGGAGSGNRHLVLPQKTEIGNLWLSVANKSGSELTSLGESTGTADFF